MKGHRATADIDVGGLLNAIRSGNRFQFSTITANVASAFGEDAGLKPAGRPVPKKLLLKVSSTNDLAVRRKRQTFLTGTEVVEVEDDPIPEALEAIPEKEPTLEEMVRDLDDFGKNLMGGYDDLAEVRRRIARCRKGIDEQAVSTYKLKQSIQALDNQNKDFLEGRPTELRRAKSYGALHSRTNASKNAARAILARRG